LPYMHILMRMINDPVFLRVFRDVIIWEGLP
jgi:hypothetical protein